MLGIENFLSDSIYTYFVHLPRPVGQSSWNRSLLRDDSGRGTASTSISAWPPLRQTLSKLALFENVVGRASKLSGCIGLVIWILSHHVTSGRPHSRFRWQLGLIVILARLQGRTY